MDYQRKSFAGKINKDEEYNTKQLLQNVQRVLKPVTIVNPYAEHLQLPGEVFKKRRTNAHYLQFIEAITFYKQYQKQELVNTETGEIYIHTDIEDIQEANELIKHILLRKSDELNGATRNYLELLKSYLKEIKQVEFKTKEVRAYYKLNYNSQKMYMLALIQNGYIKKNTGNKKQGFTYSITNINEYRVLEAQIQKILEQSTAKGIQELALSDRKGVEVGMKLQEVV